MFHQIIDQRWLRSETAGRDVEVAGAVDSHVWNVLRDVPDERHVLHTGDPDDLEPEVYS